MLVKLVSGASVNPDTLKHIYIEQKTISGKKTWIVQRWMTILSIRLPIMVER